MSRSASTRRSMIRRKVFYAGVLVFASLWIVLGGGVQTAWAQTTEPVGTASPTLTSSVIFSAAGTLGSINNIDPGRAESRLQIRIWRKLHHRLDVYGRPGLHGHVYLHTDAPGNPLWWHSVEHQHRSAASQQLHLRHRNRAASDFQPWHAKEHKVLPPIPSWLQWTVLEMCTSPIRSKAP